MTDKPKIGTIEYAWECIDRMDRPFVGNEHSQGWDDLMEYEPEDFVNRFAVSKDDADVLWGVVQARTDDRRVLKNPDQHPGLAMFEEAAHQGFDGWTVAQRLVIEAFLGDVAWAIYQSRQE